ncbi:hypothetical protein [Pseudogemmobacter bohemicus]|uniref:hypothetical protein n=1 Tax=Pseudogemmobacter bohemicus TaxID=2250708 RepID=UPI001300A1C2|nr:hypothetical protein [Pseudogemmobacter bohemicus]
MAEEDRIDFELLLENQSRIYDRLCKVADDLEYLMQKECRQITSRAIERWSIDMERK